MEAEEYRYARRKVAALRGFYAHLTTYGLVISLLFIINLATGRIWWVQWPLLGWGIAIVIHRLSVSDAPPFLGPDWEKRKVEQIVERRRAMRKPS